MIGQMAIAIAMPRFSGLGRSVALFFFPETDLVTVISTLSNNEEKINVGS